MCHQKQNWPIKMAVLKTPKGIFLASSFFVCVESISESCSFSIFSFIYHCIVQLYCTCFATFTCLRMCKYSKTTVVEKYSDRYIEMIGEPHFFFPLFSLFLQISSISFPVHNYSIRAGHSINLVFCLTTNYCSHFNEFKLQVLDSVHL